MENEEVKKDIIEEETEQQINKEEANTSNQLLLYC